MIRFSKLHGFAAILLLAVVLLAYIRGVSGGFISDDSFEIARNPYVEGHEPLTKIFTTDVWGFMRAGKSAFSNYYRPLQILAYRWIAQTAGLQPTAFHYVSLLLNWLACFAAYGIFWEFTKRYSLALAGSVLFAIHPIHSEAVLWIAALAELGCALFYFVAFLLFLASEEAPPANRKFKPKELRRLRARHKWMIALSCLAFFAALLWKEMAVTFPLLVIAYEVLVRHSQENWNARLRVAMKSSLPYWLTAAIYVAIRLSVLGYLSKVQNSWPLTPLQYVANLAELTSEYCLRLAWPLHLNAYHVFHPVTSLGDPRLIVALIFLAAAGVVFCVGARRFPVAGFAAAWIILTLVPVLNVRGLGRNVFAERYLYIPSLGFVLLVAWTGAKLLNHVPVAARQYAAVSIMVLISAAAVAEIWSRVPDWHDERTFYRRTIERSPDAAQMRSLLGQNLVNAGEVDAAEREYWSALDAAIAQDSQSQAADAYLGLAVVASQKQRHGDALDLVNKGLEHERLETLQVEKGLLLMQLGRADEAQRTLEEVVRYFPYDSMALNGLGVIALSFKNDPESAISYFQRAVRFDPLFGDGYNNLGRTYMRTGRNNEAIAALQRATQVKPNEPLYWTSYGTALLRDRRNDEARAAFQRAQELQSARLSTTSSGAAAEPPRR